MAGRPGDRVTPAGDDPGRVTGDTRERVRVRDDTLTGERVRPHTPEGEGVRPVTRTGDPTHPHTGMTTYHPAELDSARLDSAPDWRAMSRGDFDTHAPPEPLFTLDPGQVCVVDPCGTGDLLALIGDDG